MSESVLQSILAVIVLDAQSAGILHGSHADNAIGPDSQN